MIVRPVAEGPRLTAEEAAELAVLRAHRCGYERFEDFIKRIAPRYWPIPAHLRPLVDLVERSRYEDVRSLVSLPPRHGKTVTLMMALAWRVLLDPACQNFYTSYANRLSEFVGRKVRQLATERLGVPLDRSSKSNSEWNTVYGGGLLSTSLGGSIMGRGANGGLIVVDDIIKGWLIAQSGEQREKAHQYVVIDVMSRLEGGGSMIVVGTRWHEDDPIGRLMLDGAGERWQVINMPAIGDAFGKPIDEKIYPDIARPLWNGIDERNQTATGAMSWYARIRARNEAAWWSLYQGVPLSAMHQMFLEPSTYGMPLTWLGKRGCIVLDPSATAKTTSDPSGLGAFAMDGYGDASRMFVAEAREYHVTQPQVAREAAAWQRRYRLLLGVEAIGGFAGIPQMLRETVPGIRLVEIKPGDDGRGWIAGDKKMRAIPASGAWNTGRVLVPIGVDDHNRPALDADGKPYDLGWVDTYVKRLRAFTGARGDVDDLVDCTAHGWNLLYREAAVKRDRSHSAPAF